MAPWDELRYFKTPLSGAVSFSPGNVAAINAPDPQCVLLQINFSSASAGGTPIVWLDNTVSASKGIVLGQNDGRLTFTQREYGPMCTLQWFGTVWAGAGATVTWFQVSLSSWPKDSNVGANNVSNRAVQQAINSLSAYMKQLASGQRAMQAILEQRQ